MTIFGPNNIYKQTTLNIHLRDLFQHSTRSTRPTERLFARACDQFFGSPFTSKATAILRSREQDLELEDFSACRGLKLKHIDKYSVGPGALFMVTIGLFFILPLLLVVVVSFWDYTSYSIVPDFIFTNYEDISYGCIDNLPELKITNLFVYN